MTDDRRASADNDEPRSTPSPRTPTTSPRQEPLTVEADIGGAARQRRAARVDRAHLRVVPHRATSRCSGPVRFVSNVGTWMQNAALAIVVYSFQPDPGQPR